MEYRPTRDCERRVERYADLADESRASGHADEAERFLLLAWAAYDDVDATNVDEPPSNGAVCPFRQRA